jgi:hypothetical protein
VYVYVYVCVSLSLVLLSVDLTVPNLLVDPFDAGSLGIADSYRLVPLVCGGWWVVVPLLLERLLFLCL